MADTQTGTALDAPQSRVALTKAEPNRVGRLGDVAQREIFEVIRELGGVADPAEAEG